MKLFSAAVTCVAAAFVLSSGQVRAQCPTFNGTWWAFQTENQNDTAAVGVFQMLNAGRNGLAITTQTTDSVGRIINMANFTGQYSVDPNTGAFCTGELVFNQGGNGYQYEFVLVNGGTEMYLLNNGSTFPGNEIQDGFATDMRGRARKLAGAPSCQTNPLNNLSILGTNWGFLTESFTNAYVGTFSVGPPAPVSRAANPLVGTLNVTETFSGVGGTVLNYGNTPGSYMVDSTSASSCAGGQIIINSSGQALEGEQSYAFVFAGTNPTTGQSELFLVANNTTAGNFSFSAVHGTATTAP